MSAIGQPERVTQNRVIKLFRKVLGYDYLGDWSARSNSNVEEALLTANLTRLADYIVSINGKLDWPRDHVLARLSSAG